MSTTTNKCCTKCFGHGQIGDEQGYTVVSICKNLACECHSDKGGYIYKTDGAVNVTGSAIPTQPEKIPHSALKHCTNCVFPPNYNCSCSCHTQPESNWEKRLKELGHQEDEGFYIPDIDDLKDFIRAEIEATRKEEQYIARNEIEEATENGYLKGRQDVLTELEEKLPFERFWPKELITTMRTHDVIEGFNIYRTAVLSIIQQLKAK